MKPRPFLGTRPPLLLVLSTVCVVVATTALYAWLICTR